MVLSTQLQPAPANRGPGQSARSRRPQQLLPNLTRVVNRARRDIYFYYEVYDPALAGARFPTLRTSLSFYRGDIKVFETPLVERAVVDDAQRRAVVFQFQVPASRNFTPGTYTCQVNIIDAVANRVAFPRLSFMVRAPSDPRPDCRGVRLQPDQGNPMSRGFVWTLGLFVFVASAVTPHLTAQSPAQQERQRLAQQDRQRIMDLLGIKTIPPGAQSSNPDTYDESKADPFPALPRSAGHERRSSRHFSGHVVEGAAAGDRRGLRARGIRTHAEEHAGGEVGGHEHRERRRRP